MSEFPNVGAHWLFGPGRSAVECDAGSSAAEARSRGRTPTMSWAPSGEHVLHERLPVRADRRANGAVAHVVPDRRREPALRGIQLPDAGDRLHDRPRALEAGATIESQAALRTVRPAIAAVHRLCG